MKVITVLSRKGGVGKTVLSIHLAVEAQVKKMETAILDLDPQASATAWSQNRESDAPLVTPVHQIQLRDRISELKAAGADLVILDTPPSAEGIALAAARLADLVIIPCQPAILDLMAISHSVDLVQLAKKTAFAVLNRVPPRGSIVEEARDAIATYDLEVCPHTLGDRVAYSRALITGQVARDYEPKGKAAEEFSQFYSWTMGKLK